MQASESDLVWPSRGNAGDGTLSIFKALRDRPGSLYLEAVYARPKNSWAARIVSTEANKEWLATAKSHLEI